MNLIFMKMLKSKPYRIGMQKFAYLPDLYERFRYTLLKHNVNLIVCPPKKLKK